MPAGTIFVGQVLDPVPDEPSAPLADSMPMLPIKAARAGLGPLDAGWLAAINYAGYMTGTLIAALISNLRKKFVLYRMGLSVAVPGTAAMGLTNPPACCWRLV